MSKRYTASKSGLSLLSTRICGEIKIAHPHRVWVAISNTNTLRAALPTEDATEIPSVNHEAHERKPLNIEPSVYIPLD